ncbi:hypothetical protein D9758_006239 [Tetrapyrgos nigripes]|uniref:Isochorismatase-like domain-containing protein n=1 Tax=Tetrapyrgos nigripes TaxID=182062 RepID=A0A8H5GAI1_9AGAR|nr:hypothetical protein D9758_006239 [Tetrapyrgos nigripes]
MSTSAKSFRTLAGIPPSTATTKDSILIIIDAQNEYANGALAVTNLSISRPAIHTLLERYRAAQGHIAHIVHVVPEGTPAFTPGTPLAEEFDELKTGSPHSNEVVVKKRFPGSFAETELDEVVKKAAVKKVVLVGYMAHVCVSTTAREAHQKGYEVLVVEDAIGDRNIPGVTGEEVTKTVLAELGDFFATVVKSGDIQ